MKSNRIKSYFKSIKALKRYLINKQKALKILNKRNNFEITLSSILLTIDWLTTIWIIP